MRRRNPAQPVCTCLPVLIHTPLCPTGLPPCPRYSVALGKGGVQKQAFCRQRSDQGGGGLVCASTPNRGSAGNACFLLVSFLVPHPPPHLGPNHSCRRSRWGAWGGHSYDVWLQWRLVFTRSGRFASWRIRNGFLFMWVCAGPFAKSPYETPIHTVYGVRYVVMEYVQSTYEDGAYTVVSE